MNERWVSVRVTGEFACFTRPESKIERVTYPVITPSAARGVLEAIYWHPQFRWQVREVHVLRPVATYSLLRNEVNNKMTQPFYIGNERTQRHAVCLRDVDYVIFADVELKPGSGDNHAKHRDQFRRRVAKGQCYHRPVLGNREFAAEFAPYDKQITPIAWTEDLGLMLWDMDYSSGRKPYRPLLFKASVADGIMKVPAKPIEVPK